LSQELFNRFMPEGGAREVIFQVATERLLQYQNMLSEVDEPSDGTTLPTLSTAWVRVPGRRLSRRFPLVSETSALGAGLACLAMLDAFHRRDSGWQDRLEQLLWDRQPDTLLSVSRKIEACGYFTRLITPRVDQLSHAGLPALVEDDDGTPAVLFEVDGDGAVVANPLRGIRQVDRAEFAARWNGRLLVVMTAATEHGLASLRSHAKPLAAIACTALLIDIFGVGAPLAGKVLVDRVIGVGDLSMLRLLIVGVLILIVFQLLASALRDYLFAYTTRHVGVSMQRRFLHHILHLRQSVAASQQIGDLAVRFRENAALAERAFHTGVALLADTAAVLLYLAVLWWVSTASAVIALVFVAAYALVTVMTSPFVQTLGRRSGKARQAVQSHLIEAVSGIQSIKALAAEPLFFRARPQVDVAAERRRVPGHARDRGPRVDRRRAAPCGDRRDSRRWRTPRRNRRRDNRRHGRVAGPVRRAPRSAQRLDRSARRRPRHPIDVRDARRDPGPGKRGGSADDGPTAHPGTRCLQGRLLPLSRRR
jgi:hypothetical protein